MNLLYFCVVLYYIILYYYIIVYYIILSYIIILYYSILYYIILYCIILYYIILYYIILYCIILYYIILYYIILYYIILYYIIFYYVIICCVIFSYVVYYILVYFMECYMMMLMIIIRAFRKEVKKILTSQVIRAVNITIFVCMPYVCGALMFTMYYLRGNPLTSTTVFSTLALLQLVRFSLCVFFPLAVKSSAEALASMKRVQVGHGIPDF